MERVEAKLLELMEAIESGVVEYGPEALDITLAVVRVNSAGPLLGGLVSLVLTIALIRTAIWAYHKAESYENGDYRDREKGEFIGVVCLICGFGSIVTVLGTLIMWSSLWAWVGVFRPELRLARDIINKVIGGS